MADPDATTEIGRLPLVEEVVRIRRRRRISGRVRVAVTTAEQQETVEAVLHRRHAEIERVPVGREVEAPPPVRQEGETIVVPVLEERVVLVRRLVLVEEIRFRLRTEEEAVALPVTRRRQSVAVQRSPADDPGQILPAGPTTSEQASMTQRTLTAMFDTRAEAERAAEALRGLNLRASGVRVHDAPAAGGPGADDDRLNYSSIGSMWLPEEDRATYEEGLRRGGAILSAEVEEDGLELAMDAMEAAGAVDLDAREAEWRSQGWTGSSARGATGAGMGTGMGRGAPDGTPGNPPGTMASRGVDKAAGTNLSGAHPENERRGKAPGAGAAGTQARTGREETIPIAEETLRVGKRMAHGGRVRVRSYVVETPVEEQVRLREEHVHVERRPADRAATGSDADLFRERSIEAEESVEEAVVQKEARVTGEVVVNKEATEHTETIRDTVRRTDVDVDKGKTANDPKRRGGKGAA